MGNSLQRRARPQGQVQGRSLFATHTRSVGPSVCAGGAGGVAEAEDDECARGGAAAGGTVTANEIGGHQDLHDGCDVMDDFAAAATKDAAAAAAVEAAGAMAKVIAVAVAANEGRRQERRRQEIEAWLGACAREERAFLLHCLIPFVLTINCPDGTTFALRVCPRQTVRELKQAIATVSRGSVPGRRATNRSGWLHSSF